MTLDNIINGPLKLQVVLETIEVGNYNRKYGDKESKQKKPKRPSSDSSLDGEQIAYTKQAWKKKDDTDKRKQSRRSCLTAGNQTGHSMPGKKVSMQQLQENGTLCQSLPIQDCQSFMGRR